MNHPLHILLPRKQCWLKSSCSLISCLMTCHTCSAFGKRLLLSGGRFTWSSVYIHTSDCEQLCWWQSMRHTWEIWKTWKDTATVDHWFQWSLYLVFLLRLFTNSNCFFCLHCHLLCAFFLRLYSIIANSCLY